MIKGHIFRAGRSRLPSALVRLTPGHPFIVSPSGAMMVTLDCDTDDFYFDYATVDGRKFRYTVPPRAALNLTAAIGYQIVPRAVSFTKSGRVDAVIAEFVRTADHAGELPPSLTQTKVTKP